VCLDGYHFGEDYQSKVGHTGARVMVIDDEVRLPRYHADLLLDQNFGAEGRRYPLDPSATPLLGPRYALLAPEFTRAVSPGRRHEGEAKRVLVTLGGSDPVGHTLKVAEAMLGITSAGMEAVFVLGAVNARAGQIENMVRGRAGFQVVRDTTDMPGLMTWADLAVTGTGTTSWELCAMGVPSIGIVLADNQRPAAEALAEAGVFISLGGHEGVTAAAMAETVEALSRDPVRRQEMARRGQALVDGLGAGRVVQHKMKQA
jgi:spore coat polysaccharide biosynthesis predicted glycosyltransferase SpsG